MVVVTRQCRDAGGPRRSHAAISLATRRQRRSVASILLAFAVLSSTSVFAQTQALPLERIFASPSLSGPDIRGLKVSPDGQRVSYLQGKQDDREQLDLWEYHIADRSHRLLLDSRELVPEETLSDEEKARRERQRLGGLRGIVEYSWAADGSALLIPLGGDLYYRPLGSNEVARPLTTTDAFETDARLSPKGSSVAFIREQNLFVIDVKTGSERQLTHDGGGTIKNGMAEFIAQEEMGRDTGYWWSPDEYRIAFLRIDERPVAVARRHEIYADEVRVVEQRYPYAGEANVRVELGVIELMDGTVSWIDLGTDPDFYLPRVAWLPDGLRLSYQWQPRDQKTLELRIVDTTTNEQRTLLTETSATWINLHDDLRFLDDGEHFIWASERSRSGHKHLYLYSLSGELLRPLTAGNWAVDSVEGVSAEYVFFSAAAESPTQKHLYRQSLSIPEPREPQRLSSAAGWHAVTMNDAATLYVDRYSSQARPPRTVLYDAEGRELATLLDNAIDEDHPYWPYHERHQAAEFGTLEASDGQLLHYRLTRPADFDADRRYPVFVFVYGGPHSQTVVNQWGRLFEQYMLQQGFLVFSLDNRGMARRGHGFEAPIYRRMGKAEVEDQLRGVRFLTSLDYVDAERIGIFGWSYGGYMTLMSLLSAPEVFAAGVAVAPVTDWRLYDTHYTERYLGHPADEDYAESSVFGLIESFESELPPLLVMHGMADDNVLFTNSTRLFEALQQKGLLFETMTYPGGKHGLSGAQTQTHVYNMIASFFRRHLGPSQ